MVKTNDTVLVINAGGASRRMGRPKALLPVPPANKPLLAHVVDRLLPIGAARVIVVANDPDLANQVALSLPSTFVPDLWPGTGALGGIATALASLEAGEEWALIVACDMPLVSARLCSYLLQQARNPAADGQLWDCVVPMVHGFEEPLHAVYHARCLPAIRARLDAGQRRIISFMPDVRTLRVNEAGLRAIDPDLLSFANTNTPDEWTAALEQLEHERQISPERPRTDL